MANSLTSGNNRKQEIISLRDLSHEVCVAATQEIYWQQLTENSNVIIRRSGNYVPVELKFICNDNDEPRLQLIIESAYEGENSKFDRICAQIRYDLISFENNDRPVYNSSTEEVIVYGSLFNSLPSNSFDTERHLLGQGNVNIKKIKKSLDCLIVINQMNPYRWRFSIHHKNSTVMNIAAIQIQSFVKQAQYQYLFAYAMKIGQIFTDPIESTTTLSSSSDSNAFPAFTSFQPSAKRKRLDDESQASTNRLPNDSDNSDDENELDEKRQQQRTEAERLLVLILERMQARMPKDEQAKAREDSSQIRSYFRAIHASKSSTNESNISIELVEHEKDLRSRHIAKHKCTLVFNKLLKMGEGSCDSLKKTAKFLAYEKLKTMTRDTPRENLIIKLTKDGLWKAVIKHSMDQ